MIFHAYSILDKKLKIKFFFIILSLFLVGAVELVSIGAIPVYITFFLKQSEVMGYLPSNLQYYFLEFTSRELIFYSSIFLVFIFFIKNIILFLIGLFHINFQQNVRRYISSKIFKKYLLANYQKFSNLNENQKKGANIIEIVWNGQETMSKTFWLYCILVVVIVSFLSGLAVVPLGNIIFVVPAIVIIWTNTGLWRSSNIYQNQRLQSKQPYGWATAAKAYVVLNYLTTLSQLGFILKGF